ncbi:MAG: hypothetical protein ABWJ99_03060 [Caldimicrobium sp.]
MDRKVAAYTSLELLMVLGMIAILGFLFVREVRNYISNERLRQALNQFLSDLEYVKNRAEISAIPWGIRGCRGTNRYKIFMDEDGNCRDKDTNCDNANGTTFCVNIFNKTCGSINDCNNVPNSCLPLEVIKTLPEGVVFNNTFYVVFDRKGWAFNYSCGNGENNATLLSSVTGKTYKIVLNRLGRIRVE